MTRALSLEYFKLRRKRIFAMMVLFLGAEMLWALVSTTMSIARNPSSADWKTVIATTASMNGLFLPIISAIVVSRLCDMEQKGNTWKLLMATNMNRSSLYAAKFICAVSIICLYLVLQAGIVFTFGVMNGFDSLPLRLLILHIGGALLTSLAIIALQQWISLILKNQSFALCLGMIGGFIGMTADLFPAFVRRIFIWSYYSGLSPVTYLYTGKSATYVMQPPSFGLTVVVLLIAVACYAAGNIHVSRREV
ncbi:ABC transporter permease [Paenibacillus alvei]|uniref:ABC transporter permease n=1 Tax=Paenibacillus alvei TaxID=44250 RepID=A0ABT4GXM9_PAEAL|nr:ABC transporter permease [Paenibacillus alvei]EJW20197.1 putative membrane protein [Paenibacillus alvei DSM 29]MCY9539571.1 ABC transporter permease [Paenibacillus alvei]MCY9704019.1 ABC transporter permease [Paenibacillus alvei]MCY9734016.1 ABC transporter permease [Paenibacillus alvei]MCY9753826.1 ABC transporter permease [Paenibacillus alvei]